MLTSFLSGIISSAFAFEAKYYENKSRDYSNGYHVEAEFVRHHYNNLKEKSIRQSRDNAIISTVTFLIALPFMYFAARRFYLSRCCEASVCSCRNLAWFGYVIVIVSIIAMLVETECGPSECDDNNIMEAPGGWILGNTILSLLSWICMFVYAEIQRKTSRSSSERNAQEAPSRDINADRSWITDAGHLETEGDTDWRLMQDSDIEAQEQITSMTDAAGNATILKVTKKKLSKKEERQLVRKIEAKIKEGEYLDTDEEIFAIEKDLI